MTQVLGSNIEAGYYISRTGNAFAAEHLGDAYPPDQLYGLYGEYQFVAIYSDGQNQMLTNKLLAGLRRRRNVADLGAHQAGRRLRDAERPRCPDRFRAPVHGLFDRRGCTAWCTHRPTSAIRRT